MSCGLCWHRKSPERNEEKDWRWKGQPRVRYNRMRETKRVRVILNFWADTYCGKARTRPPPISGAVRNVLRVEQRESRLQLHVLYGVFCLSQFNYLLNSTVAVKPRTTIPLARRVVVAEAGSGGSGLCSIKLGLEKIRSQPAISNYHHNVND